MKMMDNIKTLWGHMDGEHKRLALTKLMEVFGSESETAIRQNWIYQERIPENHQEEVLGIFQNVLKIQHQKIGRLIEEKK